MGFVTSDVGLRWPGWRIPYEIDSTTIPTGSGNYQKLLDAIALWNQVAAVQLVPRKGETSYLVYTKGAAGKGCGSDVGCQGGRQDLPCDLDWSEAIPALMHETGHAAGLIHEHQRPERDDYITVSPVAAASNKDFIIDTKATPIGAYDCNSLMHYKIVAGDTTITLKPGGCSSIGGDTLTPGDLAALRHAYPTNTVSSTVLALVVITQDGNTYGSDIPHLDNHTLSPVYHFEGAKIGYNPQDRFMVALDCSSLVVITQAGEVFGARVFEKNIVAPVYQFSGAKIGYNPQDRFMVALGNEYLNTLVVTTQDGNVYGSDIQGHTLAPIYHFDGPKIGYNPQDRFMVALGNTLVVITQDGNVYGSDIQGHTLGPVYHFDGPKIGYNPQDRFMVALGDTLVVITQDGNVYGSDIQGHTLGPVYHFDGPKIGYNPQDRFMVALARDVIH
jgi:hypothetical protein